MPLQFSLIGLLAAVGIIAVYLAIRPMSSILSHDPVWMMQSSEGKFVRLGFVLSAVLMPAILAGILLPRRGTIVLSAVGVSIWLLACWCAKVISAA